MNGSPMLVWNKDFISCPHHANGFQAMNFAVSGCNRSVQHPYGKVIDAIDTRINGDYISAEHG